MLYLMNLWKKIQTHRHTTQSHSADNLENCNYILSSFQCIILSKSDPKYTIYPSDWKQSLLAHFKMI